MVKRVYPPELPSINLDFDWFYRKGGKAFYACTALFWNMLNDLAHLFFVKNLAGRIAAFTARGPAVTMRQLAFPLRALGLFPEKTAEQAKEVLDKRATLGIHPVGLTALMGILFLLGLVALSFF